MNFLNVKPASITLVKQRYSIFWTLHSSEKNSKNLDIFPEYRPQK